MRTLIPTVFIALSSTVLTVSGTWAQSPLPAIFQPAVDGLSATCELTREITPDVWTFQHTLEGSDAPTQFQLAQVYCNRAAYNSSEIWLLANEYGEVRTLALAAPRFAVDYASGGDQRAVQSINVTGYGANVEVSNSSFDPKTLTLTSFHKWRGMGDASEGGEWVFSNGDFLLRRYDVDASWDDEVNPQTIVDFSGSNP